MTEEALLALAAHEGFAAAAVVAADTIPFDFSFRPYCEENLCGQYGVNYACPPACGSCEDMRQRIVSRQKALVLQSVWDISDYTDLPAIRDAKALHNRAGLSLQQQLRNRGVDCFMVGASGCGLCHPCAAVQGAPCRFPQLQYSCMSAYCIFVKKLCDSCGLEYDCGSGLLSFFGMIVF